MERKVDPEFTSPRLRESLMLHDTNNKNSSADDTSRDAKRTIRDMPLMGEEMDHVTARTTNYSTAVQQVVEEQDQEFGLTEVQLYEMLALQRSNEELWKENKSNNNDDDDDKEKQSFQWMNHCRDYLEVPVILRDKDGDYIGARKQDVTTSSLFQLTLKPALGVKLVLSQLLDRDNEEKARVAAGSAGAGAATKK